MRKSYKFFNLSIVIIACLAILSISLPAYSGQASANKVTAAPVARNPFAPLVAVTATPGNERDLFADAPHPGREIEWPGAVRSRFVILNREVLTNTSTITLNLFSDRSIPVVFDSKQSLREANGRAAGEGFIWRGHIEGSEQGQVTLVVSPDPIAGNILMATGHDYLLRYADDGVNNIHVVYDIDPTLLQTPDSEGDKAGGNETMPLQISRDRAILPNDNNRSIPKTTLEENKAHKPTVMTGQSNGDCLDAGCPYLIGVLVVYTPRALTVAGNAQALLNTVNLGIDYAETSYGNSDINLRIYLANFRFIDYEDVDPGTDLERIKQPNDGYMDIVHTWRNTLDYADLVTLVGCEPAMPGPCSTASGIGDLYHPNAPDPAFWGFNWVSVLSVGGATLAHELGHNMGGGHARWDGCNGTLSYACGFGVDAGYFHTVMAYNCPTIYCKGVPYFSNPNVSYCNGGTCWPTGVSEYWPTSANNAKMFNVSAPFIANWR